MKYNSKISLKGEKEPVFVSHQSAQAISDIFLDKNIGGDNPIRVGRHSFLKSSIRSVMVVGDTSYGDESDDMKNMAAESELKRAKFLAYSPEQKSTYLGAFKLLYKAMKAIEATDEVLEKAQSLQLDFYIKNKNRMYVDMGIFKELIGNQRTRMNHWESGAVRIIEEAVRHDLQKTL